jgi:hypothetical protein
MIRRVWFWVLGGAVTTAVVITVLDAWIGLPYGVEQLVLGVGVLTFLLLSHRYAGVPR